MLAARAGATVSLEVLIDARADLNVRNKVTSRQGGFGVGLTPVNVSQSIGEGESES